jgi:glycosyltransferase involved in cell wall biosynthesis
LRVVLVTNRFEPSMGGIERQCKLLAKALQNLGIDVTVLTDRYSMDLHRFEEIEGIPVRRVWSVWTMSGAFKGLVGSLKRRGLTKTPKSSGYTNAQTRGYSGGAFHLRMHRFLSYRFPMYSLALSLFIALVRTRNEYDVIQVFQTNLLACSAVLAGMLAGKPVIARDAVSGGMDELGEFLFKPTTTSLVARHCTFVALSRHIERDLLARGIPPTRIELIPNAVKPPQDFSNDNGSDTAVLFVGNVSGDHRQKGLDILLKAWKTVTAEVPECSLRIIGGGDFLIFREMVNSLGLDRSVDFVGLRSNTGEWLRKCAIFVLPSRYEGMSNALLEAMSYAKPCVATSVSGSDDLIQHGVNGLKVPTENPDELARAIVYLIKNPAKARDLGRNARATVEVRYSVSQGSKQLAEIIDAR